MKEAADRAGKPVYLEMSSVNPVLVLPGALEERRGQLAAELFGSCTLGAGQFCTKPGLVILMRRIPDKSFLRFGPAACSRVGPAASSSEKAVRDGIGAAIAA